jgi:ATP synthase protein I
MSERRPITPWKDYGRYGTVGLELLVSIAIGYYGGRALDARFGAHGWVTLACTLLGTAVGFRALFVTATHMQRDIERAERRERKGRPILRNPSEESHDDRKPHD